jgi:hypothetical protein
MPDDLDPGIGWQGVEVLCERDRIGIIYEINDLRLPLITLGLCVIQH